MIKKNRIAVIILILFQGRLEAQQIFSVNKSIQYCIQQSETTLKYLPNQQPNIPRSIAVNSANWKYVDYKDWTCGFWPGILWMNYEITKDTLWKKAADTFSSQLIPLSQIPVIDHDLGFEIFCSYGNAYRLTKNLAYKKILLATADTLATLYNPKVGTLLSWPRNAPGIDWPLHHNTIMDNMMNLELLFWASRNGGSKKLYNIAYKHAETTMKNHFRKDYSSYHVVLYDTATGKKVKGITHQGYSDSSMWARGQAWAIYGFTMVYRETRDNKFLDFVQNTVDVYLKRLPADLIPYWDFDDPLIPDIPKDASAAAITASALLELSQFIKDNKKAKLYRAKAEEMLQKLSTSKYQSNTMNSAFLLHSTGNKPVNGEVDASIIYADYYYEEALIRLKKLQEHKSIYANYN
jgi:unsaturated chondroitin disaccharide hydrolase